MCARPNKSLFNKISKLSIYEGNVFDGISVVLKMSHTNDGVMMKKYE